MQNYPVNAFRVDNTVSRKSMSLADLAQTPLRFAAQARSEDVTKYLLCHT